MSVKKYKTYQIKIDLDEADVIISRHMWHASFLITKLKMKITFVRKSPSIKIQEFMWISFIFHDQLINKPQQQLNIVFSVVGSRLIIY